MLSIRIAVLLYAAAALALGWHAYRRQRAARATGDTGAAGDTRANSGHELWTAGRRLSAGSVGLSISAGFMSVSWSCVYAAQLFWGYGLGALWLITLPWLLALAGIYLLAGRYRGLSAFSQPEMVGERFGRAAGATVALAVALVFLVWGGAEIYVAATLLAPGLGLGVTATVLAIGLVVALYSTLGGFQAVVATDKLQFAVVALYVLLVAGLAAAALRAESGALWPPAELPAAVSGRPWTDLASPGPAVIVLTLLAYLPGWLFETDLWVRVQAARDAGAARRGMLLAGGNALLFVGLLPLLVGVASLALFPLGADGVGANGGAPAVVGDDGDALFAALVARYAPAWLAPLVAMGLVAAAMSTIDSCVNVLGLSIAYDLLGSDRRPNGSTLSRLVIAGATAASCLFALAIESLWDIFYLSGGVLTTAVAFPVAAVFWRRASRRGVTFSAAAGLAGTVTAYFLESRGALAAVEPGWLADTGLGYILWGLAAAAAGYLIGWLVDRLSADGTR